MSSAAFGRRYWNSLLGGASETAPDPRGRTGYGFWQRYWASLTGTRLAKQVPATAKVAATKGRAAATTVREARALALAPNFFRFNRGLPAAAASGTMRVARGSFVSADGAVTVNLTSPSPREIEISVMGREVPAWAIAVVHIVDESGDRAQFIPLANGEFEAVPGFSSGIVMVPTTAQEVGIGRDIGLIQASDLDAFAPAEITQSIRVAAGPTRRWWQALLTAVEAGQVTLGEAAVSAITAAITKP